MMMRHKILIGVVAMALVVAHADPETEWLRGRMAYEDGFYDQAIRIFESLIQDADSAGALRHEAADHLLQSYFVQNEWEQISGFLTDPGLVGHLDRESLVYWQALDLYRQADWEGVLSRLMDLEPDVATPRAVRLRALAHLQLGDLSEAGRLFGGLAETHPDGEQAALNRMDWGRVLQTEGRTAEAIAAWALLLDKEAVRPQLVAQARYLMGLTHFQSGEYDEAAAVLAPLVAQVSQGDMLAVAALTTQAQILLRRDDTEGALAVLRGAIEELGEHPMRRRLQMELCRVLLETNALEEAQRAVLRYVGRYTDSPDAPGLLLDLGARLFATSQYEAAESVYQRYLEAFGDREGVASHARGLALMGAGRYAEAALAFDRAFSQVQEGARREEMLLLGAEARYANQQYRLALEWLDLYVQEYPEGMHRQRAQYKRAECLAALGNVAEAVQVLQRIAVLYPDSSDSERALLRIGALYLDRQQWQDAETAFMQVMDMYPDGPLYMQALHGRGMSRYQRWDIAARDDFSRVSEEAQDQGLADHARFMLAMQHFRLGQDDEAIAICEAFLRERPDSQWAPDVRFRLAQFAYNAGRYEIAEQTFLAFTEAHPEHALVPRGLFRAGLAAINRQQFVQGIEILGRLIQRYPELDLLPYARFHQAEAMVQLGRYSAAILVYQEVIRQVPNTDLAYMAWGREGDCHFTLGAEDPERYDAAARAYQVVLQSAGLRLRDRLQAAYKLGLTYEKTERKEAALQQYYEGVIQPFHLAYPEQAAEIGVEGRTWYSRAVRSAALLLEDMEDWHRLVGILDRAAGTDTDVAGEAARKARAVRSEYWWLFY